LLFNSITFFLFLPIVFAIYWSIRGNLKVQNAFLVLASYVFYGWWDWRFLGLIIFSTLVDYTVAKQGSKVRLAVSLAANLGVLGFFKYYNFFVESWMEAWLSVGVEMHASTMQIILPVGISFYTFQTLSYSIDVYRGKLQPTRDLISFAAFVGFFPQLVAGPIERAKVLLPQIERPRTFDSALAISGLRLMLWGMFKKVVVADTCARYADAIFSDPSSHSGPTLMLGAIYFSFQIYGDFSGYSDIAIGTSRLFGIKLSTNFSFPYFSRDIAEFWRRWHISLSSWFRDYLYIPLGGSRGSKLKVLRNVAIIFLVSGLWHGANWTFVVWGGVHAALFIPLVLLGKNSRYSSEVVADGRSLPTILELWQMVSTFVLVTLAWVFFRAATVGEAWSYIKGILTLPTYDKPIEYLVLSVFLWIGVMLTIDWMQRSGVAPAWWLSRRMQPVRWMVYGIGVWLCLKNLHSGSSFIYFQF
jgi:D-alanyl-lipoteichoic acid acyltransferase DltB (MBOAT superfamily)